MEAKPSERGSEETSDRAEGEGRRCNSNAAGIEQFKAALAASPGLPTAERESLAAARAAVGADCAKDGQPAQPAPVAGGGQSGGRRADRFDVRTRHLDRNGAFLKDLRARRTAGCKLNTTGLLDWSRQGDPQALGVLAGVTPGFAPMWCS